MVLDNQTPWSANLQVADLGEPRLAAAVIGKATYDIGPDGNLDVAVEPLPILPDPLSTPFGEFHGELFARKEGADIAVLATIRRAKPMRRLIVRLEVGDFWHELTVHGDRVWVPTGERRRPLRPSAPVPFTEIPLAYSRSFGGAADYEGLTTPWPDNPTGLGYYLTVDQAREHPVPNIEAAHDEPLETWDRRPRVAGWGPYPMHWGLRVSTAVQVDAERMAVKHVSPAIFNHAHPDLVVAEIAPGTPLRVDGVWDRPLAFALPRQSLALNVTVGASTMEVASRIDGVFLWMDARKLVVTHRANFGYQFRPEEIRRVVATVGQG
jgi:hypothetical protein